MKCESPISFGSKVKVKFFSKGGQKSGSRSRSQTFCIDRKVLSQEIHLCNIKALSPFIKKLLQRLSLLWTDRRTYRQTDRQTDRHTDRVIPIYPPNFVCGGIIICLFKSPPHTHRPLFLPRS